MTEVYMPPLLLHELGDIMEALGYRAASLEAQADNEKAQRVATGLRQLAARLAKETTCGKSFG